MAKGKIHTILSARGSTGSDTAVIQVRYSSGHYQIRARTVRNNSKFTSLAWSTLSDQPHVIEVGWNAATSGSNGSIRLWVDGAQVAAATGLANSAVRVDELRLGPQAIPTGVSGIEYFDEYVSTRSSYIGT